MATHPEAAALLARSHRLGADPRNTNYAGGNTSAKGRETDPVTGMLLKSILQAMDEWHSLTSRAKGLSGMRENVRQGFRAGGRAPMGYQLEAVETGTVRDGQPVRKSRLVLGPDADAVRAYLVARAAGTPRGRSKMRSAEALDAALAALGHPPHAPLGHYDDHRTDALLGAAWLADAARDEALWHPAGLTATLAETEGWTFGLH